jgi:hypothetical protein
MGSFKAASCTGIKGMKNLLAQAGVTIPSQAAGVDAGEADRLGEGRVSKNLQERGQADTDS